MTNHKPTSMASWKLIPLLFLLLESPCSSFPSAFTCSDNIKTCNSILYQYNNLEKEEIATYYSVNTSEIKPIKHAGEPNFLVTVPCSCKDVNGTVGYFYDTSYKLRPNDTFFNVSGQIYSGQAWEVGGEEQSYVAGEDVTMHLLCGCVENEYQIVVTYTVQLLDTLSNIASLLSSRIDEIERLNQILSRNPGNIIAGWVLFVPMEKKGIPAATKKGMRHKWTIVVGILSAMTLLSLCASVIIFIKRNRSKKASKDTPKIVSKGLSSNKSFSSLRKTKMEEIADFESERPVVYSLEEIAKATSNFDETRKIGEGGYGSVYFGVIGEQEVAVKKMRSNNSKEFLAELKVLWKIHHINVVELLGYASGDDHLYLVYEFIPNGSLGDHLHDPLLKGRQPLSWTARTQIALDASKGIEYIHDHTKSQYVHRDIKTSNILLDEGLRAKVADFGLAKLVGQTHEDDFLATRLVGTPGYLPPESVKELQVTTKTDVFAFGVVLAELITGKRALIRENLEPNKIKSLITVVNKVFQSDDPETALKSIVDSNLTGSYPMEDVYKMAEIAGWCLSEEAVDRPEMREIVVVLSEIAVSSVEWEVSLGGNSHVFSGVFNGR